VRRRRIVVPERLLRSLCENLHSRVAPTRGLPLPESLRRQPPDQAHRIIMQASVADKARARAAFEALWPTARVLIPDDFEKPTDVQRAFRLL
jgi:hypothetical protein